MYLPDPFASKPVLKPLSQLSNLAELTREIPHEKSVTDKDIAKEKSSSLSSLPDIHAIVEGSGPSRSVTLHPAMSGNNNIGGDIDDLFSELGVSRTLGADTAFGGLKPKLSCPPPNLEQMVRRPLSTFAHQVELPADIGTMPLQRPDGQYTAPDADKR